MWNHCNCCRMETVITIRRAMVFEDARNKLKDYSRMGRTPNHSQTHERTSNIELYCFPYSCNSLEVESQIQTNASSDSPLMLFGRNRCEGWRFRWKEDRLEAVGQPLMLPVFFLFTYLISFFWLIMNSHVVVASLSCCHNLAQLSCNWNAVRRFIFKLGNYM